VLVPTTGTPAGSAQAYTATTLDRRLGRPRNHRRPLTASPPFDYPGRYTDPTGLIYLIGGYYDLLP
jgi:hypothetical protein